MSDQSRKVFDRLYGSAKKPADLPWHRDAPPDLLIGALAARETPGTALDVGCGAGTYSVYMAKRGYRVTGIDFMPQAIDMLARQAADEHLNINAVHADITTWEPPHAYDVVLDVGCLHSLDRRNHGTYKARLLRWLQPGGDFILVHCGRRGWWDWWPIGPNRMTKENLTALLAPELTLRSYQPEKLTGMPLFMGRNALIGRYWFHRPG